MLALGIVVSMYELISEWTAHTEKHFRVCGWNVAWKREHISLTMKILDSTLHSCVIERLLIQDMT